MTILRSVTPGVTPEAEIQMEENLKSYRTRKKTASILGAVLSLLGAMLISYSVPRENVTVLAWGAIVTGCWLVSVVIWVRAGFKIDRIKAGAKIGKNYSYGPR